MAKLCDAAFMGGGVRGIGLSGAAKGFLDAGYRFRNVAGSSAGAIVAALVAAGFTGDELEAETRGADYSSFKEKKLLDRFGPAGEFLNFDLNYGVYSADAFEHWLQGLLERKNKTVFSDVSYEENGKVYSRLLVTASDISTQKPLVFPRDLAEFGVDPYAFPIAKAVRMSMSIPLFYEPYKLKGRDGRERLIADGGLFCNYPIGLVDHRAENPEVPVFGFKFAKHTAWRDFSKPFKLLDYLKAVIAAVLGAQYAQDGECFPGDGERAVYIPTDVGGAPVGIADFDLSKNTAAALFNNGLSAANAFLKAWDFGAWRKRFRGKLANNE